MKPLVGPALALVVLFVATTESCASSNQGPTVSNTSGHWVEVAHFTVQGQRNTEPFAVGARWRFSWKDCGKDPNLTPYYAAGPDTGYNIGFAGGAPEGTQNLYNKPGHYYLSVLAPGVRCDITVEDMQ